MQRDFALKEVSNKKEEICLLNEELAKKEEHIACLSVMIEEQETKISKLQKELNLHANSEEKFRLESVDKNDERVHQLLKLGISTNQLLLKLREAKDQKRQQQIESKRAQKTLEKYEKIAVSIIITLC